MPDGTPYEANDPHLLGWVVTSAIGGRLLLRFTFRQVMVSVPVMVRVAGSSLARIW